MELKPAKVKPSVRPEKCWRCNGTGFVTESSFYGAGFSDVTETCNVCSGTGKTTVKIWR